MSKSSGMVARLAAGGMMLAAVVYLACLFLPLVHVQAGGNGVAAQGSLTGKKLVNHREVISQILVHPDLTEAQVVALLAAIFWMAWGIAGELGRSLIGYLGCAAVGLLLGGACGRWPSGPRCWHCVCKRRIAAFGAS